MAFLVGGAGATQMNGEYFLDDITIGKVDTAGSSTPPTSTSSPRSVPTWRAGTRHRHDAGAKPTLSINASVSEGNHGATLRSRWTLNHTATALGDRRLHHLRRHRGCGQ